MHDSKYKKAQGALLGLFVGDALGGQYEFCTKSEIENKHLPSLGQMRDGGSWQKIAGQLTDDAEMAIALARSITQKGTYDVEHVKKSYLSWMKTNPMDCGETVMSGLTGDVLESSESNGSLMRIAPLGIFGHKYPKEKVAEWARMDASITHSNKVTFDANALFCMGIAVSIRQDIKPMDLYDKIVMWAMEMNAHDLIINAVKLSKNSPPEDYQTMQGWVIIAFQNALYQLLHTDTCTDGILSTIEQGGDTDTNAAICGALLGAVHGVNSIRSDWIESVITCRPSRKIPNIKHPRPKKFWATDSMELAIALAT